MLHGMKQQLLLIEFYKGQPMCRKENISKYLYEYVIVCEFLSYINLLIRVALKNVNQRWGGLLGL